MRSGFAQFTAVFLLAVAFVAPGLGHAFRGFHRGTACLKSELNFGLAIRLGAKEFPQSDSLIKPSRFRPPRV
jgi:hypothetical protein